ncbi:hypothetical protein HMPREF1861_00543 [Corynebacterium kroppenstedtii]|nr:hypothetical protein HMPREF1861_00543 [Corynebacterium kroppenstedtii]
MLFARLTICEVGRVLQRTWRQLRGHLVTRTETRTSVSEVFID